MRPGQGGEQRQAPSAAAADRPFYPLADRLQFMGVGSIVIGVGFFLLAAPEVAWAAQATLLFSFFFSASAVGVLAAVVSTPRLRDSLEQATPVPPGARRRSSRDVTLRCLAHLAGMTALVAVMQVVAAGFHTSPGIVPGILVGSGGLILWNRSTVLQWESLRGQVVLAQSELQWPRIPLHVTGVMDE